MALVRAIGMISLVTLLSACGGGGGSGSTSTDAAPVLEMRPVGELSIVEGQVTRFNLGVNYTGKEDLRYSLKGQSTSDTFEWTVEDGYIVFNRVILNGDETTAKLTIGVADSRVESAVTVDASITNTSGIKLKKQIALLQANGQDALSMDELQTIEHYYTKVNSIMGVSVTSVSHMDSRNIPTIRDIQLDIEALTMPLEQYKNGLLDESELANAYQKVVDSLNKRASAELSVINQLAEANSRLQSIPNAEFTSDGEVFSYIFGVEELGGYSNGEWQYSSSYEFLGQMLNCASSQKVTSRNLVSECTVKG